MPKYSSDNDSSDSEKNRAKTSYRNVVNEFSNLMDSVRLSQSQKFGESQNFYSSDDEDDDGDDTSSDDEYSGSIDSNDDDDDDDDGDDASSSGVSSHSSFHPTNEEYPDPKHYVDKNRRRQPESDESSLNDEKEMRRQKEALLEQQMRVRQQMAQRMKKQKQKKKEGKETYVPKSRVSQKDAYGMQTEEEQVPKQKHGMQREQNEEYSEESEYTPEEAGPDDDESTSDSSYSNHEDYLDDLLDTSDDEGNLQDAVRHAAFDDNSNSSSESDDEEEIQQPQRHPPPPPPPPPPQPRRGTSQDESDYTSSDDSDDEDGSLDSEEEALRREEEALRLEEEEIQRIILGEEAELQRLETRKPGEIIEQDYYGLSAIVESDEDMTSAEFTRSNRNSTEKNTTDNRKGTEDYERPSPSLFGFVKKVIGNKDSKGGKEQDRDATKKRKGRDSSGSNLSSDCLSSSDDSDAISSSDEEDGDQNGAYHTEPKMERQKSSPKNAETSGAMSEPETSAKKKKGWKQLFSWGKRKKNKKHQALENERGAESFREGAPTPAPVEENQTSGENESPKEGGEDSSTNGSSGRDKNGNKGEMLGEDGDESSASVDKDNQSGKDHDEFSESGQASEEKEGLFYDENKSNYGSYSLGLSVSSDSLSGKNNDTRIDSPRGDAPAPPAVTSPWLSASNRSDTLPVSPRRTIDNDEFRKKMAQKELPTVPLSTSSHDSSLSESITESEDEQQSRQKQKSLANNTVRPTSDSIDESQRLESSLEERDRPLRNGDKHQQLDNTHQRQESRRRLSSSSIHSASSEDKRLSSWGDLLKNSPSSRRGGRSSETFDESYRSENSLHVQDLQNEEIKKQRLESARQRRERRQRRFSNWVRSSTNLDNHLSSWGELVMNSPSSRKGKIVSDHINHAFCAESTTKTKPALDRQTSEGAETSLMISQLEKEKQHAEGNIREIEEDLAGLQKESHEEERGIGSTELRTNTIIDSSSSSSPQQPAVIGAAKQGTSQQNENLYQHSQDKLLSSKVLELNSTDSPALSLDDDANIPMVWDIKPLGGHATNLSKVDEICNSGTGLVVTDKTLAKQLQHRRADLDQKHSRNEMFAAELQQRRVALDGRRKNYEMRKAAVDLRFGSNHSRDDCLAQNKKAKNKKTTKSKNEASRRKTSRRRTKRPRSKYLLSDEESTTGPKSKAARSKRSRSCSKRRRRKDDLSIQAQKVSRKKKNIKKPKKTENVITFSLKTKQERRKEREKRRARRAENRGFWLSIDSAPTVVYSMDSRSMNTTTSSFLEAVCPSMQSIDVNKNELVGLDLSVDITPVISKSMDRQSLHLTTSNLLEGVCPSMQNHKNDWLLVRPLQTTTSVFLEAVCPSMHNGQFMHLENNKELGDKIISMQSDFEREQPVVISSDKACKKSVSFGDLMVSELTPDKDDCREKKSSSDEKVKTMKQTRPIEDLSSSEHKKKKKKKTTKKKTRSDKQRSREKHKRMKRSFSLNDLQLSRGRKSKYQVKGCGVVNNSSHSSTLSDMLGGVPPVSKVGELMGTSLRRPIIFSNSSKVDNVCSSSHHYGPVQTF